MDSEEKKLIKLLKRAPDVGMVQVMDIHAKAVLSICRHILREENLAQDAAQETFLKLWKYVKDGREITTSLRAFIHQIARNTSLKAGPCIFSAPDPLVLTPCFPRTQDKNKEVRPNGREFLPVAPESEMGEKEENKEMKALLPI